MPQPPDVDQSPWSQFFEWVLHPLDYLTTKRQRYGDYFAGNIGTFRNFVFIGDPSAVEQIFTADPSCFEVGSSNRILRPTLGDNSVLLLDGPPHKRQRQLLMPPFHGERMKAYSEVIWNITQQVTRDWDAGTQFQARSVMQDISLRVILHTVFGLTEGDRYDRLRMLISKMLEASTSSIGFMIALIPALQRDLGPWSPYGRFLRLKAQIDELIYAEIRDRRQQTEGSHTDILSLLLAARDDAGQGMTDVELRDELITLLIAGHETTATALSWALYWLSTQPEVKAKVQAEIESLGNEPDSAAIGRLPYLNAFCQETLRIYPITFVTPPRFTTQPIQVGPYAFPEGTYLLPSIYLVHRREDLYPNADQFRPERFLERQYSPYEYFPFGGSNRRCIGAVFALFEMKLVIAYLLRHYEFALAETRPVVPARRGVTLAPKGGIAMRVVAKRSAPQTAVTSAN